MNIADIYSKRKKAAEGTQPDVYVYDSIPLACRVQVIHIWNDALGTDKEYRDDTGHVREAYELGAMTLAREYGMFELTQDRSYKEQLKNFFLKESDNDRVLDVVELTFRCIDRITRKHDYLYKSDADQVAGAAISELNSRLREHACGYEYSDGEVIRIDSELVHETVTKPALSILRATRYHGAQEEFLKAHEHYRHGRYKEALTDCLKSIESVMKVICAGRKWVHPANATSKALIDVLLKNGLIPEFWQNHFSGLRSVLESGVPTSRNRLSGHGQGEEITEVPPHLVSFVIHMTASTIVFLEEADKTLT